MNLLSATLADIGPMESNGSVRARFAVLGETISAIVDGRVADLAKGSKVTLGIRPRSFEFVDPGTTDALHATVDLTEPMGAETLAHLIEQGADMRCVVQSSVAPATGDRVAVRWQLSAIYHDEPLQLAMLAIYRFEDGRIAEDWGIPIRGEWLD